MMKTIKKCCILLILFLLVVIFATPMTINSTKFKIEKEKQSNFTYEIKKFSIQENSTYTFYGVVTIEEKKGIDIIKFFRDNKEVIINGNGKKKISIDYNINEDTKYEFKINPIGENEKTETINIKGIKEITEGKEVSYILKKDNLQDDIEMYNITYQENAIGGMFNGSSSYAKINFDKKIEFPLTVELIILPLQDASKNQIFYFDSNTGTCIGNYNGEFVCSIGKNSYTREIPDDFYDGNIKDIIITYNSITDYELYINGEKTIKNSDLNCFTSSGRYLGCGPKGQYFKGKIYEVNIYNRILEKNEILKAETKYE